MKESKKEFLIDIFILLLGGALSIPLSILLIEAYRWTI